MTGAEGIGSAASAYFAQQTQSVSSLSSLSALTGGEGAGAVSGTSLPQQSTASISGLGQLLSNLQQLQTQNPTQFSQVTSKIASELQSASQQQTGAASQFLTKLANTLQQGSTTGSLPQPHHHHHGHAQSTQSAQSYTSAGQPVTSSAVNSPSTTPDLQQLFTSLATQVGTSLTP